jgi:hypothetical protein
MRARARVAAGACRPVLDREGAEAAQLDAVTARQGGDDLAENRVDDVLDVALVEMWVLRGDPLYEFLFDHCAASACPLVLSGKRPPKSVNRAALGKTTQSPAAIAGA